ncbi:unnamed protein product, partial [Ectocarpus sp. 8 AP-2014]
MRTSTTLTRNVGMFLLGGRLTDHRQRLRRDQRDQRGVRDTIFRHCSVMPFAKTEEAEPTSPCIRSLRHQCSQSYPGSLGGEFGRLPGGRLWSWTQNTGDRSKTPAAR